MAIISGIVLPVNGQRIKVEDYNDPINKILAQVNGNLDDANIASFSGSKLGAGSVPYSALSQSAIDALNNPWKPVADSVSSVVYNGNRSYDVTFSATQAGKLYPGYRLQSTRMVAAPIQSALLNGTNQYFSRTAPANMTFTNNFVISAWIKLSNYTTSGGMIASRFNGTSGWSCFINGNGQVSIQGHNGGAANYSLANTFQSVPLNRWIHIAAQLDMSSFTATPTTSYVMIDGVDVPVSVSRGGTNPTALTQAGNLEIGSWNGGALPFVGTIAQTAIYNTKVSQSAIRATISQGLTGSEPSIISAYSLSNTLNDLNAVSGNNLTANNGATTTNADAPFGYQSDGSNSSLLDNMVVQRINGAIATVQVPEGDTLSTTGGISSVSYSTVKAPTGFPTNLDKWTIGWYDRISMATPAVTNLQVYNPNGGNITVPTGKWTMNMFLVMYAAKGGAGNQQTYFTLGTQPTSGSIVESTISLYYNTTGGSDFMQPAAKQLPISVQGSATQYYLQLMSNSGAAATANSWRGDYAMTKFEVVNNYI